MSIIDCGDTELSGLSSLPKFREALAVWMRDFDRVKETPFGPIEVTIRASKGFFGEVSVTLSAAGKAAYASWSIDHEYVSDAADLIVVVGKTCETARLRLMFNLAMQEQTRKEAAE